MTATSPAVRKLLALLYPAGALVLADQAADLMATLLANAPALGAANWRFGAFGLLVSRASVFLLADVMLFAAAIGLAHRSVLRALGVIHLVLALVFLGALGVFGLDWLQVRTQVNPDRLRPFDLAAVRAAAVAALSIVILIWAGVASFRAARVKGPGKGTRREEPVPLLTALRQDELR